MRGHSRALAHTGTIALVGLIATIAAVGIYASAIISISGSPTSSSSQQHTFLDDYAITSDPSSYFPNGYYSYKLNFTSAYYGGSQFTNLTNGQIIDLAGVKFAFVIPSGSSTVVTTANGQVETGIESIEYICGSFFNVTITTRQARPAFLLLSS